MTEYLKNINFKIKKFELLKNQGICNHTYLLTSYDSKYIIKKFDKTLQSDANKKFEYLIQLKAYEKNLAPKPILIDIKNDVYISKYLEGLHKITLTPYDLRALASALYNLHKIKIHRKPYNIERYLTKNSKKISKDLKLALLNIKKHKKDFVLCHNDLNPKNIIFANDIKFIDWEFAGINDRYFDLAAIIIEFDLNLKDERNFLRYYFKKNGYNREKLETYKIIYKYTCKIWLDNNTFLKKDN